MILVDAIGAIFVLWSIRRGVQRIYRAKRGFNARVEASRRHLLDPGDQLKVFLTERDLVSPTKAFEEAYGATETEGEASESAAVDKAIATALQEKSTPASAPPVAERPRSFGRRRAG